MNNYEAASLLILNGAQVGLQDNNDKTPLSIALAELGTLETAEVLMHNEAYMTNDDHAALERKKSTLEHANMNLGNNNKKPQQQQQQSYVCDEVKPKIEASSNTVVAGLKRKLSDVMGQNRDSGSVKNSIAASKKSAKSEKAKKWSTKTTTSNDNPKTSSFEYKESCLNVDYPTTNSAYYTTNNQYDYGYSQQQQQTKYSPPPSYFPSNQTTQAPPKYSYENTSNGFTMLMSATKLEQPIGNVNFSYMNDKNAYEYTTSSNNTTGYSNQHFNNHQYHNLQSCVVDNNSNKHDASKSSPVLFLNPSNLCFNNTNNSNPTVNSATTSNTSDSYAAYF